MAFASDKRQMLDCLIAFLNSKLQVQQSVTRRHGNKPHTAIGTGVRWRAWGGLVAQDRPSC